MPKSKKDIQCARKLGNLSDRMAIIIANGSNIDPIIVDFWRQEIEDIIYNLENN